MNLILTKGYQLTIMNQKNQEGCSIPEGDLMQITCTKRAAYLHKMQLPIYKWYITCH